MGVSIIPVILKEQSRYKSYLYLQGHALMSNAIFIAKQQLEEQDEELNEEVHQSVQNPSEAEFTLDAGECDEDDISEDNSIKSDETVMQESSISFEGLHSSVTVENTADKLIYPNARISNVVSMVLIMTFAMNHRLSGTALKDFLQLIDIHYLIPNPLIQSLYKFKQFFNLLQHPLKTHYYCFKCGIYLKNEWTVCPNMLCQQDFTNETKPFY